ncbi:MAG: SDR family NAD(P)-dependent oxidoreductase [Dehalococcoidia bacterium]|nr:SDR family NAD(P)-dependent oxidoreductase [Dehalococcoidia bacterium]
MGLTDKLALVAGGSRGIGKAIALDLAREGADVAIAARNAEQLERTAAEIEDQTGRRAIPLVFDATSTEQSTNMVNDAAAQLGGLHILVNSASLPGGSPSATGPVETVDEEDLLRDFDVKYVGALRCAKAAPTSRSRAGAGSSTSAALTHGGLAT